MINLKKVIIPILILSSLILGGCFKKGEDGSGLSLLGNKEEKGEPFKGSMMAAAKLGIPFKCSYSVDGETQSEGYIKGKNYRGKAQAEKGKIVEMIMKDNCMWNWDEDTKEGVKFCLDTESEDSMWNFDEEDLENMDMPEGYEPPDMEYDCRPAIVTDSMFTPPTDVKFVDMQQMLDAFTAPQEGFDDMDGNVDMEKLMEQYGQ